jgi:hypothetical protein
MSTHSLGAFTFFNLENTAVRGGAPETVRRTATPIQRPGTNGTGFVTTGIKGRPFQMRSVVDVTTQAGAVVLIKNYELAVNKELVVMIHAGADYSATPVFCQYWIMEVTAGWRRVSCATGGLNGGNYFVEAFWTLIPVLVEPEE